MQTEQSSPRAYLAVDLKSFYASVECVERGLDPLTTNLVVADTGRTEKTICLAVSPSLKAHGIAGRARLFEVIERLRAVNRQRQLRASGGHLTGKSWDDTALRRDPSLAVDYLTAVPQMAHYIAWSMRIYEIYLKYIAPEDIHVYSIDEVFIDATNYLPLYGLTARALAARIVRDIVQTTGITATAGVGTNLYLAKVAMDIVAKHTEPNEDGIRIAQLDEQTYREQLWTHRPLTDFWRVGRGYARKLEQRGLFTMGDIARCSLGAPQDYYNEELLYRLFGVNAELLIDHAWGVESCTMAEIKAYRPAEKSVVSGQVLQEPYSFSDARLVLREMVDLLALDLVEKQLVTDQIVLVVGYDRVSLTDPARRAQYDGPVVADHYGRAVPKHAQGTVSLGEHTNSARQLTKAVLETYDHVVQPALLVRRLSLSANHLRDADEAMASRPQYEQLDLFTNYAARKQKERERVAALERERQMQQAILSIKRKFGKNAILKGMDLQEAATTRARNNQIGGHRA